MGPTSLEEEEVLAKEEEATEAEFAFKDSQLKMQQAVKDLSSNIEVKEQLMAELTENAQRFERMRTHYESAVLQREAEAASTMGKLSELQNELDQKENDLASQKQR